MLRQTLDAVARISPRFRRFMMKSWYELLVVLDHQRDLTFMNYGHAGLEPSPDGLALSAEEEPNRYCIQLYHHVAAAVDLKGKDVVEVGSGRGGGAPYIARHLGPRTMKGIDFAKKAVEFCRSHHSAEGLSFVQGDAENLPLADGSVDAVVNVESSHCYGSMPRFLSEVHRVLRPGGHFLFTDHRDHDKTDLLREQLKDAGLTLLKETDITKNVVRALDLDNDRKQKVILQKAPRILRKEAEEFAAMKGSRAYESFKSGYSRYLSFVLQKGPP